MPEKYNTNRIVTESRQDFQPAPGSLDDFPAEDTSPESSTTEHTEITEPVRETTQMSFLPDFIRVLSVVSSEIASQLNLKAYMSASLRAKLRAKILHRLPDFL